jgi:tRNA(Met) cytidine acetyltransferase
MDFGSAVAALRSEATATNQRRLLVVHGDREQCLDAAYTALNAGDVAPSTTTFLTTREGLRYERYRPKHADSLLGTTREAVVFDGFEEFSANALGQTIGAVEGGGLYVLLLPPLSAWLDRKDDFRASLAVPPFSEQEVTGLFRERFVETLRTHPGVAIYDANDETIERDGLLDDPRGLTRSSASVPRRHDFPAAAYEACLTADQGRTLAQLERLATPGEAVVVEADRGRGKSSVAGLAAGSLAAAGKRVLVTAPAVENAAALFERARALVESLGVLVDNDVDEHGIETTSGGEVTFVSPTDLAARLERRTATDEDESDNTATPDAVIVDEAAALPVRLLETTLAAPSVAFVTTVHGYEGTGRGFSVRFRDRLAESSLAVTEAHLDEPIRYAPDDPVESWAFRALLFDARPAVEQLVADAEPETVEYRRLSAAELAGDEHLLRETFGLLVLAHYRTEPDDLARLLDAPNLSVHALLADGHVVSVALLAREGGLSADRREEMFRGGRIRGNMIPDLLTGQLRDGDAGEPVGYRVMRIATHDAVRRSGFGSRLLGEIHDDLGNRGGGSGAEGSDSGDEADYFGTGFGATPGLVEFWRQNDYHTVHVSTTRNDASGEHSAVMLRPVSESGTGLFERHSQQFRDRIAGVLGDTLRDLDPDVVRAALRACAADSAPLLDLSAYDWRLVVGASTGPGQYSVSPRPFQQLALAWLLDSSEIEESDDDDGLTAREERLLVRKVLQTQPWDDIADELGYVSTGACMRALGDAYVTLVDRFGGEVAVQERERYEST